MTEQRELSSSPSMLLLYGKAVGGSTVKPVLKRVPVIGGRFGAERKLPDTQLVLSDAEMDRGHLHDYDRVCGFHLSDELPPTYPHMLAFPLAMQLMTDNSFPFPVIGLVQIRNRIEQERPITADERLTLRVHTGDLEPHDKGTQFQIYAEAEIDGSPVWRSMSTYLRKEKSGDGGNGGGKKKEGDSADDAPENPDKQAEWDVPDDIGRRYAKVSGDSNPIHLRRSTAMAFGMSRPISHGMWSKARCLAALEGLVPDKCVVDVAFKLPMFLPAKVTFKSW